MGGRPGIVRGAIGEVSVVAWGEAVGSSDAPGVVPRPFGDDGIAAEYPRGWRSGGTYKIAAPDGALEWEIASWRALVRWRDLNGRLHMIRKWASSRTRAAEAAMAAATEAVGRAVVAHGSESTPELDNTTIVRALVDQVMKHHVPSLSSRTQEEYSRVRVHLDDDRLPRLMGELPRQIDAGMVRSWVEAYVELHGPSSAARARALVAKALDRATESKRMATQVNPVRAVPGVINWKALRRRTPLTKGAPSDRDVADLLARLAADPIAGLPSGKRRQASAGRAGSRTTNPLDIADIVWVSFLAGLRIGEISALRWKDLALLPGHGSISVSGTIVSLRAARDAAGHTIPGSATRRQGQTKSPAGVRIVPITDDLAARFVARADEIGIDPASIDDRDLPVFPSPGRRGADGKPMADSWRDQGNLAKAIRAAYDRHGWQWASSHTGRRWRATSLLERGFGVQQVGEMLGHGSPRATWVYAKPRGVESVRSRLAVEMEDTL